MREWCVRVNWNDGPFIIGDPDKLFPGLVKFDKEKLAALSGSREIWVEASNAPQAFYDAAKVIEDEGHQVSSVWFVD